MSDTDNTKTRQRAARLLGYRAMSRGELYSKLILKGESKDAARDAVAYLVHQGYLNDAEYAVEVVRYYMSKGQDVDRIKYQLRRRLVSSDYWADAFEEASNDNE